MRDLRRHAARWLQSRLQPRPAAKLSQASATPLDDVIDLGHRIILGRPADPGLRAAMLAQLTANQITPGQVWATFASSREFDQRVRHQRAVIEASTPETPPNFIDVNDLKRQSPISEHNLSAESYFSSRSEAELEELLAKPFADSHHTTELLTCFGHMVAGLRLVPGDVLLDFAVGSGWTSWNFSQLGAQVICSDVAKSALAVAEARYERWPLSPGRPQPRYLPFDGFTFDLPDESVDKACCFDAFHHLVNQGDVLLEFARVLKPGGILGFDEPGRHHSKTREAQFEMKEYGVIEGDIDLTVMAKLAAGAGLEFLAADVLTVRPIWADLDSFNDLVDNRVPDAAMVQAFGEQIQSKQLFLLRKPGKMRIDSRSRSGLGATLDLLNVDTSVDEELIRVQLEVGIRNTGEAHWLAPDAPIGAVNFGGRVLGVNRWEGRAASAESLALASGKKEVFNLSFAVPIAFAGRDLFVNLVSERVAWFDTCGTPTLTIKLPSAR